MPFSPALKLQVKRMAAFQCCRCHEIGVDIHHIIPQAQGGPDDIDNAAPLCQNCHARFGANPEKRTEIRQMREFWYDVVKEKYHGDQSAIEKLNETLLKVQAHIKESNQAEIDKLRSEVIEEVKVIRALQEQAAEQLKYVPVVDIPRQANTVVGSSNIQSHGHAGNVEEGSGAKKRVGAQELGLGSPLMLRVCQCGKYPLRAELDTESGLPSQALGAK